MRGSNKKDNIVYRLAENAACFVKISVGPFLSVDVDFSFGVYV